MFCLIAEGDNVSVDMAISSEDQLLFNSKSDFSQVNIALRVVNGNFSLANFIWYKGVLVEDNFKLGCSLINTAPCGNLVLSSLSDFSLMFSWCFSDNEDLLVFHVFAVVSAVEDTSEGVLYLGLGLLAMVVFEVHG